MDTFGVNPSQNNRKLPHLAQTQVPGPRSWVWARCGKFLLFWDGLQPHLSQTHGSGPQNLGLGHQKKGRVYNQKLPHLAQTHGSGPRTMGLGQMWSFLVCPLLVKPSPCLHIIHLCSAHARGARTRPLNPRRIKVALWLALAKFSSYKA